MGKIAVKVVTSQSEVAGGLVGLQMLQPLQSDVILLDRESAPNISGGVLPVAQATADALYLPSARFNFASGNLSSTLGLAIPFTRATTKTSIDFEGNVVNLLSGEWPFSGLRRVRNVCPATAPSEGAWNVSTTSVLDRWVLLTTSGTATAGQNDPAGGTSGLKVDLLTGASNCFIGHFALTRARQYRWTVWLRAVSGTTAVRISATDTTTWATAFVSGTLTLDTTWRRYSLLVDGIAAGWSGTNVDFNIGSENKTPFNAGDVSFLVAYAEPEDVTGQSNTNPSEYVSVGVLSSPYHGANVDGVKWFPYQNGNSVSSNVVTEARGAEISLTNTYPPGFRPEQLAKNCCLQSENFGTTWAAVGTPTRSAAAVRCGSVVLDLLGDDSAAALEGYTQSITFTGDAVKTVGFFIKKGTATSSVVRLRDTSASADRLLAAITWTGAVPTITMSTGTLLFSLALSGGVYLVYVNTTSVTAANTNSLQVYPATDAALAVTGTGDINIGGMMALDTSQWHTYIPTTTAAVTVNADQAALTSLGSWFNPAEGTIVCTFVTPEATPVSGGAFLVEINDGTGNERIVILEGGSRQVTHLVTDGAVTQVSISTAALTNGTRHTDAFTYKVNDFAQAIDGGALQTDVAGTLPTVTRMDIGYSSLNSTASQFGGVIQSLTYIRTRVPDATLKSLSA